MSFVNVHYLSKCPKIIYLNSLFSSMTNDKNPKKDTFWKNLTKKDPFFGNLTEKDTLLSSLLVSE